MKEKGISKSECKKKALSYLSRYTCSSAKLREYLIKKGCAEHAEKIVSELIESGLLDDFKNAQLLVEIYRRKLGKKAIVYRLLKKGFSKEIADAAVSFSESEELEAAIKEAEKKALRLKEMDFKKARERLYRFLLSRGFSTSSATKAVRKILGDFKDSADSDSV